MKFILALVLFIGPIPADEECFTDSCVGCTDDCLETLI